MGKAKEGNDRSILRLLFWEGLGLAGFLHVLRHPVTHEWWSLHFFHNALFFLVAYPLLYVARWKATAGCLHMILLPLSFVLSWALGLSAYLWTTYWLYITGSPYSSAFTQHEIILGILFVFVYFPLIQPLWGISRKYFSLGDLTWLLLYSSLGGFLGFLVGRFVDQKIGENLGTDGRRFLLWLILILLGLAIGALTAQRRVKE